MTSCFVRLEQFRSASTAVFMLAICSVLCHPLLRATAPIQDLAHFRRLTEQEIALRPPVKLRAVVTYYVPEHYRLYIQDGNFATYAYPENVNPAFNARRGDLVELTGIAIDGELSPIIHFSKYEIISHDSLPPSAHFTLNQLDSAQAECRRAHFSGRVLSAYRIASEYVEDPGGGLALVLGTPEQKIDVTVDHPANLEPASLLGADIKFDGIVAHTSQRGQFLGSMLYVQEAGDLHMIRSAGTDPYSVPIGKIHDLLRYDRLDWDRVVHVQGVVTQRSPGDSFYIQDDTQGLLVETLNPVDLRPGDSVDVIGYPSPGPYSPVLRYALFRRIRAGVNVLPIHISSLEIPENYSKDYASSWLAHDGKLVEIEAELLGQRVLSKEVTFLLRTGKAVFSAKSDDRSTFNTEIETGSILKLRGVCTVSVAGTKHRPEHMDMLLRSSSDITVLKTPPWWTGKHLLAVSGISILCVILLATWSFALRSQVRAKTAELRERATRDGLTLTWNRAEILALLKRELASAERHGSTLTVVLLDLDHFKVINDNYGHQVGDAVLIETCCRLQRNLRATDAIGRYGGEEFLLLLPGISGADRARIEELRTAVADQPVFYQGFAIPITCSLGVSWSISGAVTSDILIKAADDALYRAKRNGRNCVDFEPTAAIAAKRGGDLLGSAKRLTAQDAA